MNKLTRKQCNGIIKTRASMLSVKTNHKKSNGSNLVCRFCSETEETQEHILQTCHYGNQSRGYLIGGRPLWPPAVPRLAARSSQSNPRGSGPEVLKRERGHMTAETGVAEVGVFRALQPNAKR